MVQATAISRVRLHGDRMTRKWTMPPPSAVVLFSGHSVTVRTDTADGSGMDHSLVFCEVFQQPIMTACTIFLYFLSPRGPSIVNGDGMHHFLVFSVTARSSSIPW